MSDPINPSTVQLIDIEHLLDDSESIARQKLLACGFDPGVIDACVTGKPFGRYMGYVQDEHPLLFNYEYRYDIALLQHIQNLRVWLAKKEIPADEWLSHGYALAWMHHHSTAPDRYTKTISLFQTEKAKGPRSRNPLADEVIDDFREKHEPPANSDIKCFGRFVGKGRVFDDLNIEVVEARNTGKRIIYKFKLPGSKEIFETISRGRIGIKLKELAKKDKK